MQQEAYVQVDDNPKECHHRAGAIRAVLCLIALTQCEPHQPHGEEVGYQNQRNEVHVQPGFRAIQRQESIRPVAGSEADPIREAIQKPGHHDCTHQKSA